MSISKEVMEETFKFKTTFQTMEGTEQVKMQWRCPSNHVLEMNVSRADYLAAKAK